MKKKKDLLEKIKTKVIFINDGVKISREGNEWIFEIGVEMTNDVAEAVSIMIREVDFSDSIWGTPIRSINTEEISPKKALYWLSGGDDEWNSLDNYNKNWGECYLDFQEEFGMLIFNIIKRNKKLKDIRTNYYKYLSLSTLYDFALSKNMIK